ncbi:biotin-dependent carboxyltransferase family protein [Xanthovirga aplysinae]|uniref:5-oxoprolinase subunit C family protein n=1 Tax=Xanthovirga aplysinae TaxID=2529853 RepID=UPI0012BBDD9A|nr:biotin-dependent carboxyltransferase family protein [Xanthovirga aplysinae]MTI30759.1 biotin-dependent carboxyltransferase [Xanthovirga aplysinae]
MSEPVIFHFKKPGLQTMVQDLGRVGFQAFGVPTSGVMDKSSAKIANWLVGNPRENPVLEITLLGPQIEIKGNCQIALTGGNLSPTLNGNPIPMYETIQVDSGSILSFGRKLGGCRTYLAIRGKWQIKKWLGSYSASAHSGLELTPDSIIQKNSSLQVLSQLPISKRLYSKEQRPIYSRSVRVRVLPGPEFDSFSPLAIGHFFSRGYQLTPDSNRMGYRLDGQIKDFNPKREVISSGIIPGTIQITNSGQPIILLADAQTTGGYFRLVNVISHDLDKLAQLMPGDEVWFSLISLEEAKEALKEEKLLF